MVYLAIEWGGVCLFSVGLALKRHHTYLHIYAFRKASNGNRFACREDASFREIRTIDRIHLYEKIHTRQEDAGLHHMRKIHLSLGQYGFQVLHHPLGLSLHALHVQATRFGYKRHLTSGV